MKEMSYSVGLSIRPLLRECRRAALRNALAGSERDRMMYCICRASANFHVQMSVYGTATMDPTKTKQMILHWFARMERLADTSDNARKEIQETPKND